MLQNYLNVKDASCDCPRIGALGWLFIGFCCGITLTLFVEHLIYRIWKTTESSEYEFNTKLDAFRSISRQFCCECISKSSPKTPLCSEHNPTENDEMKVLKGAISLFESQTKRPREKVVHYLSPQEVHSKLFTDGAKSLSLDCDLSHSKSRGKDMLDMLQQIQHFSVDTNHPLFFNQLFGATDPIALSAELVALSVNTSAYTFETAPIFTMIERELISNVGHLVFGHDIEADGLVLPGGSLSNLTALHIARHFATMNAFHYNNFHNLNEDNMFEEKKIEDDRFLTPRLTAFVSSEAHYSFIKAMKVLGMGSENLIIVPALENGQMDPEQLDILMSKAVKHHGQSKLPFFVGLTAGSTVRGSFDNIQAAVDICKKYERYMDQQCSNNGRSHKIWIHVDGAWGGPAIFSKRPDVRGLLNGIEYVDSFTFNPHKMLGAPQQTTIFVARHKVSKQLHR